MAGGQNIENDPARHSQFHGHDQSRLGRSMRNARLRRKQRTRKDPGENWRITERA